VSTTNTVSGVAKNVVQAGHIENLSFHNNDIGSLELDIPALDTPESLLSFANTTVEFVGRTTELEELTAFLAAEQPFLWWAWTGPAGIGKSRIAVELCRFAADNGWHAGFLREADQSSLGKAATDRPSLVVVDYAAQRSQWLSDVLSTLSRRSHSAPMRLLILERNAVGEWWSAATRVNRMEESCRVSAVMHAEPRRVSGIARDEARSLARRTAAEWGVGDLTKARVEDIVDQAEKMDPSLRPLFVQIAALDQFNPDDSHSGRDTALRRLIARKAAWLDGRTTSPETAALGHNLRFLATCAGGFTVHAYDALHPLPDRVKDLLPAASQYLGPSTTSSDLVDGIRPDIMGELYVLDYLDRAAAGVLYVPRLLAYAAQARPDAYRGFVERTVADHPFHPRLLSLLDAVEHDEPPLAGLQLALAVMPLLERSDNPVVQWTFDKMRTAIQEGRIEPTCRTVAAVRFKFANLVWKEGDAQRAKALYSDTLADCDTAWTEYAAILNNRGIVNHHLGDLHSAAADFTRVIAHETALAEARACSLNNRADIFDERNELASAIADRSAVLDLVGTTYNRRFIALARRARALRRQGRLALAYADIDSILDTSDITVKQKLSALLLRAEWADEDGDHERAQADLDTVEKSHTNFEEVERRIRELRSEGP
jgi:tetratricopeptide (TPR) repeat protein